MKNLICLLVIIAITSSVFAMDTIILNNRRTIEGTIKGASDFMIYIDDTDGVTSVVPKTLVKHAFKGNKNITLTLMTMKDYASTDRAPSPLVNTARDSISMNPSVLALNSIDSKLTMIAIPMWVSLVAGIAVLLFSKK